MSLKLVKSEWLEKLWYKIVAKDGEDVAEEIFGQLCAYSYNSDERSIAYFLYDGSVLTGDFLYHEYKFGEHSFDPNPYYKHSLLFLFHSTNEIKLYNQLLRTWCKETGRKLRSKPKSKVAKKTSKRSLKKR